MGGVDLLLRVYLLSKLPAFWSAPLNADESWSAFPNQNSTTADAVGREIMKTYDKAYRMSSAFFF